jgi:uncharacterized protein
MTFVSCRTPRHPTAAAPRGGIPESLFAAVEKDARGCFRSARGSHDWDHTRRVLRLCLRIGRKEAANLDILRLAALLHDVGREEEDRSGGKSCHAAAGAVLARGILERHGLDAGKVREVVHCVRTHRFRRRAVPKTLEARILFDADKLDSIGAVGIGRAFLFAGEVGARLHNPGVDLEATSEYGSEDSAWREFSVKLRFVRDRMLTAEGRAIAEGRHRAMEEFFERLHRETEARD